MLIFCQMLKQKKCSKINLRTKRKFYKERVKSSHPDLIILINSPS